ncbi:TEF transcription factor, PAR bZIP family member a isoform X2 [Brienomyrus brachyistius]|uniref:TEF transcription factor, PAR bZIP family member a isoform X2 n=1 Tax=Brienomyrus brachyistius TaxID=42636 RepID=UPI0020B2CECB|nr:TEF transcription factor, PAR bZIP family member a isoform X2 [Brienomyrus brachyistius]
MPGESTVTVSLESVSGPPSSFPVVLKKMMEIPPPNILEDGDDEKDKDLLCAAGNGDCGGGGGSGGMGPSASLTPAIWDKTIPYDGETFHLEYMDLDEFLLENGIPAPLEQDHQKDQVKDGSQEPSGETPPARSGPDSSADTPLLPVVELDRGEEELVTVTVSATENASKAEDSAEADKDLDCVTPTSIDPEEIEVEVNFKPDPTDLVLSSVPGGELFNPRKHRFSEEELKPQPMIKKAKKVFVPEDQKDEKYWQRRKKNNMAAKRSRDARRLKENQITVRAAFLEQENMALRQEVAELRKDYGRCKNVVARYEAKYGPIAPVETEVEDQ